MLADERERRSKSEKQMQGAIPLLLFRTRFDEKRFLV